MTDPELAMQSPDINLSDEQVALVRSLCERTLAARPELNAWLHRIEIRPGVSLPFLPIRCFRLLSVSRMDGLDATGWRSVRAFRSSGSTNDVRATHLLSEEGLASYKSAVAEGFLSTAKRFGIPRNTPIISLVPSADDWTDSSLSAMLSLWKESGLNVYFIDISSNPGALADFLSKQAWPELVLFGTSLHHLSIAQWHSTHHPGKPFIEADKLWCFDTGGTKGRTQHTKMDVLHAAFRTWVKPDCALFLLSEYGMCELSSQAYSLTSPHNGAFRCSHQLFSFALKADFSGLAHPQESGFLSFIDLRNVDSWPCIISEDLGYQVDASLQSFVLLGRAPDATLKGCSLNVRSHFRFDLAHTNENELASNKGVGKFIQQESELDGTDSRTRQSERRTLFSTNELLTQLNKDAWPASWMNDLKDSFLNWDSEVSAESLIAQSDLSGQSIAIVASANIPITWLFPAVHCWLMGSNNIQLFLPSIRQEDPLTELVRKQITALVAAFNNVCKRPFIQLQTDRLFTTSEHKAFNKIVVFGSDETIKTINNAILKTVSLEQKPPTIIGLGHFQNKIRIEAHDELNIGAGPKTKSNESLTAKIIATHCARWLGRGCLTPLCIEVPSAWGRQKIQEFIAELFEFCKAEFATRITDAESKGIHSALHFAHRHNLAELNTVTHTCVNGIRILQSMRHGLVFVDTTCAQSKGNSNLTNAQIVEKLNAWAGCGWVNISRTSDNNYDGLDFSKLASENPAPGVWDIHQGQTWQKWLVS